MVDADYRKRAAELVKKVQEKGLVKKYSDFCKTKEYALSKEEIIYYTSKAKWGWQ